MSMLYQMLSVVGQVLLVAVLLALLTGRLVQDLRRRRIVVAVLMVLCMLIPLNGLTVAQWLRSVVGDLSVLTLLLLLNIIAQRLFLLNIINNISKHALLLGIALVGVVFYPLALGLGAVDPYHLGYAPLWMGVLLVIASVFSWFRGLRDLAMVLLLPLLAFNLRLLESANLWDYLLDPVLLIYAVVQSAAYLKARWAKKNAKFS
jgi:hypothetical protein